VSDISDHILFARLADLVESRLTPGEQIEVRQHLLACPRCAADVAWLERVIGLMRTDTAENPPAHAVDTVKRLLQPPAIPSARRQLAATLQFDSARTPSALGMRAGAQTERQMLFVVSSYLLDLRIAQHGGLWTISGQLLGADKGRQIQLHGSAGTERAALNDLSEFTLPSSPPGNYTLIVQLTDLDITIAGLELGA
jgi:anti-sigma factor RsiW